MDDIPHNPPLAPDPGHGGDGLPDIPAGIASAAREWNRQHPGWVATYLPKAPSEWKWIADRNRRLSPGEVAQGLHSYLYAPDLDVLSDVVSHEMKAQASGQPAPLPPTPQPWGGDAA